MLKISLSLVDFFVCFFFIRIFEILIVYVRFGSENLFFDEEVKG